MSRRSVRGLLMWLIGLLGIMALIPAAMHLSISVDALRVAQRIAERNRSADLCMAAVKDFAFERGRTNVILHSRGPISPQNRQFVDQRRAGADLALKRLLASLPASVSGAEIDKAFDTVKQLRQLADRNFALPLAERDSGLSERWVEAANHLIARIETLLFHITRLAGTDSTFDRMSAVRLTALRLRNVVGFESSIILSLVAGKTTLNTHNAEAVFSLRGQSMELWSQLEREIALLDNQTFSNSLSDVRQYFFNGLRGMEDNILKELAHGRQPKVTLEEFSSKSVLALDSIIASLQTVSDAIRDYTDETAATAKRRVVFNTVVILFSMVVIVLCVGVISRRMTTPLNNIVGRIDTLLHKSIDFQSCECGDEFAKVSFALDALETTLSERERDASALADANRKLVELAVTDELTGLFNRRRFNEQLAAEWSRAKRNDQPLAVFMIDIDHFKKYNDLYGHQAGDDCLVAVARVLRDNLRRSGDVAARYGGEEFVVISPNTSIAQARDLSERLRLAVEGLDLPHRDSPYGKVTASVGASSLTPFGSIRAEYLVNLADTALYCAKEKGRNRTESLTPEEPSDSR